jgi:hypothetical protein
MRVVVEIVDGPSRGARMELRPGQVGQVGKASWAEMSLPRDLSLAGLHFAVECGAEKCLLRALNRQQPTFLNDTKVTQKDLADGDTIKAGDNVFRVQLLVEPAAPGAEVAPGARVVTLPSPEPSRKEPPTKASPGMGKPATAGSSLLEVLLKAQPLFAVLDAARDEQVLELLRSSGEEFQSLYEGAPAEELETAAPYLVRLPSGSKLLQALATQGWGRSWGVFLTSPQPFKDVRKHLRRFLKVESEGEEYLFRFYDPRVLRVFLPVCDAQETSQFFGPVERFLMEAKDPALLIGYAATPQGAREQLTLVA